MKQLKCNEGMPIFCIASNHSLEVDYEWFKQNEDIGVCSPVLYVAMNGTYKCKVTDRIGRT